MLTNFVPFCDTTGQDAEIVTSEFMIYKLCVDPMLPSSLVARITPDDQSEKGATFKDTATPLELKSAASSTVISSLYNGNEVIATVSVQKGAFNKIWDEIRYGLSFEEDNDMPGWEVLEKGDQLGIKMPRFSVAMLDYAGTAQVRRRWMPNCEIMVATETTRAAGNPYQVDLTMKAHRFDQKGTRYTEWVKS